LAAKVFIVVMNLRNNSKDCNRFPCEARPLPSPIIAVDDGCSTILAECGDMGIATVN